MTFSELEQSVKELRCVKDLNCNLFDKSLGKRSINFVDHLYVEKKDDVWLVYLCGERDSCWLIGEFYTESNLYEFIYCYYKKHSDIRRLPLSHVLLMLGTLVLGGLGGAVMMSAMWFVCWVIGQLLRVIFQL